MKKLYVPALMLLMAVLPQTVQAQQRQWQGHTYKIIRWEEQLLTANGETVGSYGFDWDNAVLDSFYRGGHLVTITSQAEWDVVFDLWKEFAATYHHPAFDTPVGLSPTFCLSGSNRYEWITGEPYTFSVIARDPNELMNKCFSLIGTQKTMYVENVQCADPGNGFYDFYIFETDPPEDTDGDGVSDYEETVIHQSDITKADTDGDGFSDLIERLNKTSLTLPNTNSSARVVPITVQKAILIQVMIDTSCGIFQLQESSDLVTWHNVGGPTKTKRGGVQIYITAEEIAKYQRVIRVD